MSPPRGRAPARLGLTDRDRHILHACWSLGAATGIALHALISPQVRLATFSRRLRLLSLAGYLTQHPYGAPGHHWLYTLGRAALAPGQDWPWRPGPNQFTHTVAVAQTIVSLTRTGFAAPVRVTGWQGEGELRAFAAPGSPFPDARIDWQRETTNGAWLVEVDRGTEASGEWRRKLVRYLTSRTHDPVLTLTTSDRRAVHLAQLALEVGVPMLATTAAEIHTSTDPVVLDTRSRTRGPLSATTMPAPVSAR